MTATHSPRDTIQLSPAERAGEFSGPSRISAAELPEFPRRTAVLTDDLVDFEDIELAGTKAVDSVPYMSDKFSHLGPVILSNGFACGPR